MNKNENKLNALKSTQRIALRGTNRGVHSHHFMLALQQIIIHIIILIPH